MRFPRISALLLTSSLATGPAAAQEVRPQPEAATTTLSSPSDGVSWLEPGQFDLAPVTRPSPWRALRTDFGRFVAAENRRLLGAIAVATLASRPWDTAGIEESREHLRPATFGWGNTGGGLLVQGGGALATWALGRATGSPRLTALGGDLVAAQLVSQTFVQGLKYSVRRTRPDGSNSLSFPSGHTASTFATATVLQRHFGWKAGVPAYAFATYVGAARMSADKHHLSDVVLGAGIGLVAGRSVTVQLGRQQFDLGVAPAGRGAMVAFTRK